jgi:hypothetical protein
MQGHPTRLPLAGGPLEDARRLAVSGVFVATRVADAARVRGAVRLLVAMGELDYPAAVLPSAPVVDALETLALLRTRHMARLAVSLSAEADLREREGLETLERRVRTRAAWALSEGNRAKRVLLALRSS